MRRVRRTGGRVSGIGWESVVESCNEFGALSTFMLSRYFSVKAVLGKSLSSFAALLSCTLQ